MSQVQRFWCHEAQNIRCVREEDYDAAQSQLAALREEHSELVDAYAKMQTGEEKMLNRVIAERDALREELANVQAGFKWESERAALLLETLNDAESDNATIADHNIDLQQRLADAERRNAEIRLALSKCSYYLSIHGTEEECAIVNTALNPNPEAASHE